MCPQACLCDHTPVHGHDKHMSKVISFMKVGDGHTRRIFFMSKPEVKLCLIKTLVQFSDWTQNIHREKKVLFSATFMVF